MNRFIFFFRGANSINTEPALWSVWIKSLREKEVLIDDAPLIRDGVIVINNEQETRVFTFNPEENACGFIIIKAENIDEAVKLSKDCPIFLNGGHVTIRPIVESYN